MPLKALRTDVYRHLGDPDHAVWDDLEIDLYLQQGLRELSTSIPLFWDWTYPENVPRGFSYTAEWEKRDGFVDFDYGHANYTLPDERRLLGDELDRVGPGNHTSPFEIAFLDDAGASTAIPATATLPDSLTEISRVLWDQQAIDAYDHGTLMRADSRYELTTGEVFGYVWRKDGVRTLRKVRVPADLADTHTIEGGFGILRVPTEISTDTVSGTFGVPRRIAGQHPLGSSNGFGIPRRPYREGSNVRVEHWRLGSLDELPARYRDYLREYALFRCLDRAGPGQDRKLAVWHLVRWNRGLKRIRDRLGRYLASRIGRFGEAAPVTTRPPRPRLPWQYGQRVR